MTKLEEKLIEEINGHKFSYVYDDFRKGYNGGLNVAIETINQYNIITAPKSIKLSEIVNRLKNFDCYTSEIKIDKHEDATIIEINYYSYTQCECGGYIQIIDGTICDISFGNHSYHKWLYTLWIANVEIVDDLECDE